MKILALLLSTIIVISSIPDLNEKKSSGKITYKIILPENEIEENFPEKVIFCFKDKKYRCDFDYGSNKKNENFSIIKDSTNDKNLILSELNGKKYCISTTKSKSILPLTWKVTNEKEKICGVKCIKYQGTYSNPNQNPADVISAYYSDEINSPVWCLNKPGEGVFMKFELLINGNKIIFEATNIDKNIMPEHFFAPPSSYQAISEKEWVKLLTHSVY